MQCHVDTRLARYYCLEYNTCYGSKNILATANWGSENNDCSLDSNDASLGKKKISQVKKREDETVKRNIVGTARLHVTSPPHIVSHTLVIQIW